MQTHELGYCRLEAKPSTSASPAPTFPYQPPTPPNSSYKHFFFFLNLKPLAQFKPWLKNPFFYRTD